MPPQRSRTLLKVFSICCLVLFLILQAQFGLNIKASVSLKCDTFAGSRQTFYAHSINEMNYCLPQSVFLRTFKNMTRESRGSFSSCVSHWKVWLTVRLGHYIEGIRFELELLRIGFRVSIFPVDSSFHLVRGSRREFLKNGCHILVFWEIESLYSFSTFVSWLPFWVLSIIDESCLSSQPERRVLLAD